MRPYKWIWQYISKYKVPFIFGLCLSLASTALSLVSPYISGRIVDEVFQKGNRNILLNLLLVMVTATFLKSIAKYSFQLIFEHTSQNILMDLRKDLYRRVQVQSFHFFDTNRVGDIMARMTGDLEAIRHFLAFTIYSLLENALTFIIAITLMFFINWQITLGMLAVAPVILLLIRKQSGAVRPMFVKVREQFSRLNSVCQENISGNRVVKAFTKEDYETEKFTRENQAYYDTNIKTSLTWIRFMPITDFIAGMLSVILLFAGGIFVILGKLELWQMVTINGYLWAVSNPMRMIGWLVNDVQRFAASLDKIYDMMCQKIKIENPKNPVAPEKIKGKVEFKNVSFGYDQFNTRSLVLKNISFTAENGHMIGIVGATGSGKTTLINLISRYYDVLEGEVLVDGINVRDYNLYSLRKGIAAATQDIFLFSDTIEGNIAYGSPEASMEAVTASADTASASGFISETSEGYDTIIGERGVGLSGGQKQRLSLARAIAANPSILILDDTTSAVDMETEHEIQQALKEKHGGLTKFIIAHRISSVKAANLILVLENGEIIERGTHDELVNLKGHYYSLFISQYGEYAKGGDLSGQE